MRNKKIITIATLVAVIALAISVPIFASGCGDDQVATSDRLGQQWSDRDSDGTTDGYRGGGHGIGRMDRSQDVDRDGVCDEGLDCDGDCDGDCENIGEESPGADSSDL